ncbi:hypothetical protein GCM10008018_37780 [Paenibacillus marchantiophytorum]|uniref:Flp pilus-assembly TadG-like N-terminal domain-containing protein n=1 Tax=Paenibacillus marchantiophytorum TaxID=1619310 RepID=A0ABQ1EVA8_9BACL|nr:hypothetical protein [Paenibacillus marchantiophytorum]GFZ88106.1 hypothetical protein GCM10008018_37780 [Paenibacillus marchantiophytorum]
MRRLFYSEDGAVTVYLILIIVPIFLFQAVLIDFARIKLAERESESAVKAATRSVMSSFDQEIQTLGLYGLGISQPESEELFRQVFTANLSSAAAKGSFHYVDTRPVDQSMQVTPVYSLASHNIFQRQVLEDMKIKAPIEYTLEITDKFRKSGTKAPFQLGSQFAKQAAELEKLIEQREAALDDAWQSSEELVKKASTYHLYYQSRMTELDRLAGQIGIHTIDEVREEIMNVKLQLQSLHASKSELGEQLQILNQKLNDLETLLKLIMEYTALLMATKLEVSANELTVRQLQQTIESDLRIAKQRNDEIRTKINEEHTVVGAANEVNEVFQNIPIIGDDYFYKFQTSVASIAALFAAFQELISSIYLYSPDQTVKANSANDAFFKASTDFYGEQSLLEKKRIDRNVSIASSKKKQQSQIQAVLDQAKEAIGGCSLTGDDAFMYNRLQGTGEQPGGTVGYYQKYREANAQNAIVGSEIAYDLEKSEPVSLKAMGMLEAFNNAAEKLRDELYVNEYALTKFNSRTYGLELDAAGNAEISNELVDPGSHPLANQEVEYLLYGFSSCKANIASAYAEMFAFRMAIRAVEALLDPKKELLNVGSPMLVLLVAAVEGALKAFQDMTKLTKGEAVELSAKITKSALSLTYKDYLRIFLLLHSSNSKLMSRLQALIELNTGKDLLNEITYVQGNAASEIKLWFIPQMMKAIDGTGLLGCKVQGNRCRFTQTAAASY